MTTKTRLHELIDELSEDEWHAAERYLEYLRDVHDPVLAALRAAPLDDEPEMEDERLAVAEAWDDVRAGRVLSADEVRREFT